MVTVAGDDAGDAWTAGQELDAGHGIDALADRDMGRVDKARCRRAILMPFRRRVVESVMDFRHAGVTKKS